MIGVCAKESERPWVTEFFELFKTPWEYATPRKSYSVVISTVEPPPTQGGLTILFSSAPTAFDRSRHLRLHVTESPRSLAWKRSTVPIYGASAVFEPQSGDEDVLTAPDGVAGFVTTSGAGRVARIGYDLFSEVRFLLTHGQPAEYAMTPTLDHHVALVRNLVLSSGSGLLEVLPKPCDCDFLCCLTHDVDFLSLRRHRFDRTLLGFLYRAVVRTPVDVLTGKRDWNDLWRNWNAALKVPFVFLGLIPDPWRPFHAYVNVDGQGQSTFFVIPKKNYPGAKSPNGDSGKRGVRYEAAEVAPEIAFATGSGAEVGLHGIDAWCSLPAAREEQVLIQAAGGTVPTGVRMHWLYFDEQTPEILRRAGLRYDSSFGYNEAIGFRSGTAQVHSFPQSGLLELPLHIQDTALFFSGRMGLRLQDAEHACDDVINRVKESGGVLTINWHDRSLAPERLWDRFYRKLLEKLKVHRVWFTTGSQAVGWFEKRRSISFSSKSGLSGEEDITIEAPFAFSPAAVLRRYEPGPAGSARPDFTDIAFNGISTTISLKPNFEAVR